MAEFALQRRAPANGASRIGFAFGLLDALAVPGPILIPLLGHLGTAEPAARQLLSRFAAAGDLQVERHGRVAVYNLAGAMLRRYRTISDSPDPLRWEGAFAAVIHDIPQSRRRRRERLLAAAAREGFGQYRPGLLLGCRPARSWLDDVLADESLGQARGSVEVAELSVDLPTARRMAAIVWDYPQLRERVQDAVVELTGLQARAAVDGWAHARRVHDAFVIATPLWLTCADIPGELFPADVAIDRIGELVTAISAESTPHYVTITRAFLDASPHRALVRPNPARHHPSP